MVAIGSAEGRGAVPGVGQCEPVPFGRQVDPGTVFFFVFFPEAELLVP